MGDSNTKISTDDLLDTASDLLLKLQSSVEASGELTDEATTALTKLLDHNSDPFAHADIRQKFDGDFVDEISLNSAVQQHNEFSTSHPELLKKIEEVATNTTATANVVDKLLDGHNEDDNAHPDIRASVAAIKLQLGETSITDIVSRLESVEGDVGEGLATTITLLQNVDAEIKRDATYLKTQVVGNTNRLAILEHTTDLLDIGRNIEIDKGIVERYCLDMNERLGYAQHNNMHAELTKFKHTLPTYIGEGWTTTFTVSGAIGTDLQKAKYSIEYGTGNAVITPTANIEDGSTITITNGTGGNPGDIFHFILKIHDKTGNITKRTMAFMINYPLDPDKIVLQGIPGFVEPGRTYDWFIRNSHDTGNRFTYDLDPLSSKLSFSRTSNIGVRDALEVTVPTTAARGDKLYFNVIARDKYGKAVTKSAYVTVNTIMGAEGFYHNLPPVCAPGSVHSVKFGGITDEDGFTAVYDIKDADALLAFSKEEGIIQDEQIDMIISPSAVRGADYSFTVVAKHENGASVEIPLSTRVNNLPSYSNIECSLVRESSGGVIREFTITAMGDSSSKMRYEIDKRGSTLVFSKLSNIIAGELLSVSIPKVAVDTDADIYVYAVDEFGEKSAEGKRFPLKITPVYKALSPAITSPSHGSEIEPGFTITISPFDYTVDMSSSIAAPTDGAKPIKNL